MRWKSFRLVALAGLVVLVLLPLFVVLKPFGHKLVVRAYFTNAMGLRAGAAVRLAGVDIGSVKTVRARPELKESPVEVVMVLNPQHDLNIPGDSTVVLETAGVLGATFVEIDASHASGPPIGANSVLKAQATAQLTTEQIIEKVSEILGKKSCDCQSKEDDAVRTSEKKTPSKNPSH